MNRLAKQFFLFVSFLMMVCAQPARGQFTTLIDKGGQVYFQKYSSDEISANFDQYSPQSWAIIQDKRGVIYFANNSGLLEYDGKEWRMVEGSKEMNIKGLAMMNDEIFAGGSNDMGVLKVNKTGMLYYSSIVNELDDENKEFGRIWSTFASDSAVYFLTLKKLFRWKNGQFKIWDAGEMRHYTFGAYVNNKVYINIARYGLCELANDELQLLFLSGSIKDSYPYFIRQFVHPAQVLIGTFDQGLFIYENKRLNPFKTQIDEILKNKFIYNGLKINENLWAVCTQFAGYFLLDSLGRQKASIDKDNVLEDNFVSSVLADKQDGLWSTSGVGDIYRTECLSPLTYYTDNLGLSGLIQVIVRFEGLLYVGTLNGLFYLNEKQNQFIKINEITLGVSNYHLSANKLVVVAEDGLFSVKGIKAHRLFSPVNGIFPVTQNLDTIIALTAFGILKLRAIGNVYLSTDTLSLQTSGNISSIVQDADGGIWLDGEGVLLQVNSLDERFNKIEVTSYDTSNGLPEGGIYIPYMFNDGILIGTNKGIFKYDEKTSRFVEDDTFGDLFKGKDTKPIVEDQSGNIWVCSERKTGKLYRDEKGNYQFDYAFSLRMDNKDVWTIYHDVNGIVWFGTTKGLIRYDTKINKNYHIDYQTLVRKVLVNQDSVIFWGTYYDKAGKPGVVQPHKLKSVLDYTDNSILFQYSATNYEKDGLNEFSYFLEGFDEDWSGWSLKSEKEYTNLPEGKYIFRVKSKNIFEHEGLEAKYEFTILTPFYRSPWFYGGQIGFMMLLFGISYYFGRSGSKWARLAPAVATVAIVILFEYFQNYIEDNFANLLGGITVLKVLVNVLLVFLLLPLEKMLKKLFKKG